jgi:glucosamine-6-phosphate deaminase
MDEGSYDLAKQIAKEIREKQSENKKYVMVLPGGRSPHTLFNHLISLYKNEKLSFNNVVVFLLYEFYPLISETNSNLYHTKQAFLDYIDIPQENIFYPDGFMNKNSIYDFSNKYENLIKEYGGIDLCILGIGLAGTIGLNSSGSSPTSRTHFVLMDNTSRKESAQLFSSIENVPEGVITMGIGTIMDSKRIALISWGENKSAILKKAIEGPITDAIPATCLQHHTNANAYIDLSAAFDLTRISHPWLVTNCEWDNKLIRRAIVWLCLLTKKPILKLTNKDYSEHGLGELLAVYGSAYNVNIRIFNDIQHTITGWPGGKPNADDSNRPERAEPYPKKIIVFSPHPDDDVISMGGTFRRLCDQNHDVHVAYQVSGNIAVGDEEVIRYCEFLSDVCKVYSPENNNLKNRADEIIDYLRFEKNEDGSPENPDVLFIKGMIRREEAKHASRYSGVKDENIHFLDLPFYETGLVKKNPISQKDVDIIKDLLLKVKPDSIRSVFKQYTDIELTEDEYKLLLVSKNYHESDYMKVGNSVNMVSSIVSIMNSRTHFGFTTGGHTGEEVFLAVYHPKGDIPAGMNTNIKLHQYMYKVSGLKTPMETHTKKIFAKHCDVFSGLDYSIDKSGDFPVLVVNKNSRSLKIPAFKSVVYVDDKPVYLNSVTVYIDKNDTFYLPEKLREIF